MPQNVPLDVWTCSLFFFWNQTPPTSYTGKTTVYALLDQSFICLWPFHKVHNPVLIPYTPIHLPSLPWPQLWNTGQTTNVSLWDKHSPAGRHTGMMAPQSDNLLASSACDSLVTSTFQYPDVAQIIKKHVYFSSCTYDIRTRTNPHRHCVILSWRLTFKMNEHNLM